LVGEEVEGRFGLKRAVEEGVDGGLLLLVQANGQ
jgi:hypothetical protein